MWIRPLDVEDAAWLAPMAERVFATFDPGYGQAIAGWVADPSAEGWAVELDGAPVGFALVTRLGVVGEGAFVAELAALAVEPELRRRGVGRTLLATVLRNLRGQAGFRELIALVAERNVPARALFAQAGFADLGPDGTYPHGEVALRMRWRRR